MVSILEEKMVDELPNAICSRKRTTSDVGKKTQMANLQIHGLIPLSKNVPARKIANFYD